MNAGRKNPLIWNIPHPIFDTVWYQLLVSCNCLIGMFSRIANINRSKQGTPIVHGIVGRAIPKPWIFTAMNFFHRHRHYIPPDPPGYFDFVVWPMYLKNKKELANIKDVGKFPYLFEHSCVFVTGRALRKFVMQTKYYERHFLLQLYYKPRAYLFIFAPTRKQDSLPLTWRGNADHGRPSLPW